jgi:hypothetical protein
MSDSDARLKVTADTTGAVGPLDAVTAANERVGGSGKKAGQEAAEGAAALSPAYEKAAAAVDNFAAQAEKGGKGAAKAATLADLAIEDLEAEISRLKALGQPTAALEASMGGLRAKVAGATEQVGRFRAAAADAADKMKAATARAGETDGAITGLADAVKAANFALGEMVAKVGISLVVFKQAYAETRNLIAKAKELGIDVDKASLSFLNITRAAEEFVNVETKVQTATRENSEASTELAQIQAILATRYNDTASSIEEARAKLQAHSLEAYKSSAAIKQQNEALFGKESLLKSSTEALLGAIAAEEKEGALTTAQVEIVKTALKSKAEEYQKAGQAIDAALQTEIDKRGVVVDAVVELSTTTVASAETRASAEEAASARTVAAIEAENVKRQQAVDTAKAALDQITKENDAAAAAANQANQGSPNPNADKAAGLKKTIQELEGQLLLTPEQQVQLDTAKNSYAGIRAEADGWFGSVSDGVQAQISETDALREANAQRDYGISLLDQAQAAHDQVIDRLEQEEGGYERLSYEFQQYVDTGLKAGDELAGTFSDASQAVSDTGDAYQFLGDQAEAATDAAEGVADAGAAIGDETKKGTDEASEGLDKMKAGLEEAIPLAETLRGILQEIVTLGAQADI